MSKKVLIIVLLAVVLLGGGTYFVLRQMGILADSAVGVAVGDADEGLIDQTPYFSVNTGADEVNQGDDVTFDVNLQNLATWPSITPRANNAYILAGKVFDGKAQDGSNILAGYNYFQYIYPYYTSDSASFPQDAGSACVDRNRRGRCQAFGVTAINETFKAVSDMMYKVQAKVPAAINPTDGELTSQFDLFVCDANKFGLQAIDTRSYSQRRSLCNVTRDGRGVNATKVASSGEVAQTIVTKALANMNLAKTVTANLGENNMPHLYTAPTTDQKSYGYLTSAFENIGTGYSPVTYFDLDIQKDLNNQDALTIDKVYYGSGAAITTGSQKVAYFQAVSEASFVTGDETKLSLNKTVSLANDHRVQINRSTSEIAFSALTEITTTKNDAGMSYVVQDDATNKVKKLAIYLGNIDATKNGIIVVKFRAVKPTEMRFSEMMFNTVPVLRSLLTNVAGSASAESDLTNNGGAGYGFDIHFGGITANPAVPTPVNPGGGIIIP